jgi:RNA polymerase sigma-70 factor (ECF subfamily)
MREWDEGAKAWPQLASEVTEGELAEFLAARAPADPPPSADLLLVCACVLGRPAALAALEKHVLSQIPGWVARIDPSPDFGEDVAQAVRELLLTGDRPRLREYAGKGSLEGWVRVSSVRIALRQKQRRAAGQQPISSHDGQETSDPGSDLAKAQARAEVEEALEAVLASLDAESRAWLKLYYLDGLSHAKIASVFAVHTSTISRRLSSLEERVLGAVRERLKVQLRLPTAEVDSLIRFVRSQLEVSLGQALQRTSD